MPNFLEIVQDPGGNGTPGTQSVCLCGPLLRRDTQNQPIQTPMGRAQQFMAELRNRSSFFQPVVERFDEANAKRLMDASGDYRYTSK